MIVQVIVVLNRTVVVDIDIFRVEVGCVESVDNIKIWLLTKAELFKAWLG